MDNDSIDTSTYQPYIYLSYTNWLHPVSWRYSPAWIGLNSFGLPWGSLPAAEVERRRIALKSHYSHSVHILPLEYLYAAKRQQLKRAAIARVLARGWLVLKSTLDNSAYFPKHFSGYKVSEVNGELHWSFNPADVHAQPCGVTLYPGMIELHRPKSPNLKPKSGGGMRGQITEFSGASRLRLLRLLCKLRPGQDNVHFITLTYSDDYTNDAETWKRDLDNFGDRLLYHFPGAWVVWRMEFQTRKSGVRVGDVAPHFHLLVGGIDPSKIEDIPVCRVKRDWTKDNATLKVQEWVKRNWYECNHVESEQNRLYGADVEFLQTRRKAFMYVSKYAAKVEIIPGCAASIGRIWGKRGSLPLVHGQNVPVTTGELNELRRLVRAWMKSKGKSGRKFAKRLARARRWSDVTIFGLGSDNEWDENGEVRIPPIYRFLEAATDLDLASLRGV